MREYVEPVMRGHLLIRGHFLIYNDYLSYLFMPVMKGHLPYIGTLSVGYSSIPLRQIYIYTLCACMIYMGFKFPVMYYQQASLECAIHQEKNLGLKFRA